MYTYMHTLTLLPNPEEERVSFEVRDKLFEYDPKPPYIVYLLVLDVIK